MERTQNYIYGNTVRAAIPKETPARRRPPVREESERRGREEREALRRELHRLHFFHLVLMLAGITVCCAVLIGYLSLRLQMNSSVRQIAQLKSHLNTLKQENDEAYNQVTTKIDLEEIKKIAIQKYGMRYASDGQVIRYSDAEGSDYVRQNADIPDAGR